MAKINQALLDIQYLGKRLKGIMEVAEDIEELQRLLTGKEALEKKIEENKQILNDLNETIKVGVEKVQNIDSELGDRYKKYQDTMEMLEKQVEDKENEQKALDKKLRDLETKAEKDAEDIIQRAKDEASGLVREAEFKVKEFDRKREQIEKEIQKLKEKF